MRLILNEQEVTDGVCVYVANQVDFGRPENVEVAEVGLRRNGDIFAEAIYHGRVGETEFTLDTDNINEGISLFLDKYHSFDPNVMSINLEINETDGIVAEVLINEE